MCAQILSGNSQSAPALVSGYDPATGICWQFHNKGDRDKGNGWRCKCPAHTADDRTLAYFGRCQSGARWFWTAITYGRNREAFGWEDTEPGAMAAAIAAIRDFHDGPTLAGLSHGIAENKLKELNRAKRAARPASGATEARATEYLFGVNSGITDWNEEYYSIYAFPIVKKTAKRIYYRRRYLKWLPEIDAPDISEGPIRASSDEDDDLGFVGRQVLEQTGEHRKYAAAGVQCCAQIITCPSNRRCVQIPTSLNRLTCTN